MRTATTSSTPRRVRKPLLARLCARLGGWCDVLRAHSARTPF